jgi:alkylhydroperoxidase/carboxymuconolactone decarboxylase family protein YurZ
MIANGQTASHLDDLRTALVQGMTHWVGGMVKAALIGGCTRQQLVQTAGEVGPYVAKEAVRRALDEWGWIESRRRSVTAELSHPSGLGQIL